MVDEQLQVLISFIFKVFFQFDNALVQLCNVLVRLRDLHPQEISLLRELVFEEGLPVHDLVHLFDHQLAEFVDVIDEHVVCEMLFFFTVDIFGSDIGISELFLPMRSDVL